jgi:hypothetical protein
MRPELLHPRERGISRKSIGRIIGGFICLIMRELPDHEANTRVLDELSITDPRMKAVALG